MKRIGLLMLGLVLLCVGLAHGSSRGLTIKTKSGHKVGGYSGSYALIVGVSDYRAGWPRLESIPSEMQAVRMALQAQGFEVSVVMNPDGKQLEGAFEDFIDKYGYDDGNRLLFFYAGHGYSLRDGEKGYLVPVDAPVPTKDIKNFMRKSLDMTRILALSREMSAKHALFLFDSCFSGAIFKTRAVPQQPPHISAITAKPVRQFITAGSAGQEVPARSVFAPCFIKALRGEADLTRDGYVTGTELGLYLREKVVDYGTGQTPQYGKIKDPYLDEGDFVFMTGTMVADGSTYGAPASQPATQGSLRIESEPSGAQIFLDGNRVGRTPKTLDGLNPGRVTVRVEKSGYQPMEKQAHVMAGDSRLVAFPLPEARAKPGRLYVLAKPGGATVRILNISPRYAEGMSLKPGKYHVEVSKSGYGTIRQWVELGAGQDLDVPVTLEKTAVAAAPAPRPASPSSGKTWRDPTTGMEFVFVPGGCYQMGSNSGDSDEKPVHEVCVDGFWMGKYEVTQAEWQRVMGNNPSHFKGDRNPVEQVSWYDAQEFIKRLNAKGNGTFRLPTEAEWEYAARSGGKDETYAGGNDVDRVAWYGSNSGKKTHPVGTKAPNGLGLYDMTGNVWEWCQDWYNQNAYSQHSRKNPIYSGGGGYRVSRGGGWYDKPSDVRSANRLRFEPGFTSYYLGFRLLRTN